MLGNISIAKIAGVLTTVLLVFAIRFWFSIAKKRNNKIDRIVLNANDIFELVRYFPFLKSWNKSELTILKDRIGIVLSRYPILGTDHLITDKEVAIKFAAVLVFLGQDLSFSSDVKYIQIIEEGKTVDDKEIIALPFNSYQKVSELKGQSFVDIQFRNVDYTINGFRNNPSVMIQTNYNFVNPKAGFTYFYDGWQAFLSFAMGSKEPNRDDFEAGKSLQPKAEKLQDFEWGIERKNKSFSYGVNFYYMNYKDQLVLTGKINDVGAYTRSNIAKSYRAGIEIQSKLQLARWFNIEANITLSENKVKDFTEFIDDYDNGGQVTNLYKKSTLSFSPSIIAGSSINFIPFKNGELSLINKYVGRQFLDNTEKNSRSLNAYYVQDIKVSYLLNCKILKEVRFIGQLNNIFNKRYESNGYTFSYVYGGLTTENYYFPMAPLNGMLGINISL
jgi:hypothetical protein